MVFIYNPLIKRGIPLDKTSDKKIAAHVGDADIHREINDLSTETTDLWSADKINTHTSDADIHREINDLSTETTDLWSADKINSELALKTDEEEFVAVFSDMHEPTGFVDRSDSTIAFVDGTLTFSITPVSPVPGFFTFYEGGTLYTKTAIDSIPITDVEGIHIVYYDGDTLTVVANPTAGVTSNIIRTKTIVSIIYWDATNKTAIYVGEERHGCQMDGSVHTYLHYTEGLRYISGLGLASILVDENGNTDTHAQFGVDFGDVADEDLYLVLSAVASTTGLPVYYKSGATPVWRKSTNAGFSVIKTGTAGEDRLAYNQLTGGAWKLTEVTDADFVLCHVFATTEKDSPIIAILGEAEYANLNKARQGATTELRNLLLDNTLTPEIRPLGTVIFQTKETYSNAVKARIRSIDGASYVDWRSEEISRVTASSSDHNQLSNLQGGSTTERYHMTAAEYVAVQALSSIRYKDNVEDMEDISWVDFLRPVNFEYKNNPGEKQYGLIAEEVEAINPSIVAFDESGLVDRVSYLKLIPILLKAIQDLKREVEDLKSSK